MTTHGEMTPARPSLPEPPAGSGVVPLPSARIGFGAAGQARSLGDALELLRAVLDGTRYPLDLPGAAQAAAATGQLTAQLDDYLLPRVARLDAPMLVVVGGPTGAGKSTLVNSLVRAPVSPAGVLRPTTRTPVLISNPVDAAWFADRRLLPDLPRTTGLRPQPGQLQLISAPALAPGLALLDAPDIDSVGDGNRALAERLLAAADLWLFVTTAARYADAVPWQVLRAAYERGTAVTLVLDRVPPGAEDVVAAHFTELIVARDLSRAHLFILPEVPLDGQGLLADRLVRPLRDWLAGLAAPGRRAEVVQQTLGGALRAVRPVIMQAAAALEGQAASAGILRGAVLDGYAEALTAITEAATEGVVPRGDPRIRGHRMAGGDWMSLARDGVQDQLAIALGGSRTPGQELADALGAAFATLIQDAAARATEEVRVAWHEYPEGRALLRRVGSEPPVAHLADRSRRLVQDWQQAVLDLVQEQAARGRGASRGGVRGSAGRTAAAELKTVALLAVIEVLAPDLLTEAGLAADSRRRDLAGRAREDLLNRVHTLLEAEVDRYTCLFESVDLGRETARHLRAAAAAVSQHAEYPTAAELSANRGQIA